MIQIPKLPDVLCYSPELPAEPSPAWCWWDTPDRLFGWQLMVRCEHGHWGNLKHQISDDGTASPSIYFKGMCGDQEDWHVWGKLLDWTAEDASRRSTK